MWTISIRSQFVFLQGTGSAAPKTHPPYCSLLTTLLKARQSFLVAPGTILSPSCGIQVLFDLTLPTPEPPLWLPQPSA